MSKVYFLSQGLLNYSCGCSQTNRCRSSPVSSSCLNILNNLY